MSRGLALLLAVPAAHAGSASAPAAAASAAPVPAVTEDLNRLLTALTQPHALSELAVLAASLLLAALLVWGLRQAQLKAGRMLVGQRLVDGAVFPLLAFLLAAIARRLVFPGQTLLPVFQLALPILFSLAVIRSAVHVLRMALPQSGWVRVVERWLSWLAWIGVVLWVTGVLPLLLAELDQISWTLAGKPVTLRKLIEGAISAAVVLMVALWVSAAIESRLLAGAVGESLSLRKVASNVVRALLMFVGLLIALSAVGIDLTALGVLGGAIGVGIGFGLQKLAANYVSGFVILAERSLRIGDWVRIDNFEGRIADISTRYTRVRSAGGRESLVPNEMLITTRVENLSLADPNVLLQTVVQVAYGTDVASLRARMVEAVARVPRVLASPGPSCHLTAFAADGLELTIFFWIADPDNGQANVRGDVNLAVLALLTQMEIDIPFPQRVVHLAAGSRMPPAEGRPAAEAGSPAA
ncbi:mechanosensitive ion channel [Piscinibacter sp. Jin2]|uniref:Mechanosensitive ion channel n=1 Tax=Aquariibacter lacus TaxID=2801332 RepID=A0A9X0XEY3_9BURK|nr:mechanosensitive ion channel [Piscinibacter lacus]